MASRSAGSADLPCRTSKASASVRANGSGLRNDSRAPWIDWSAAGSGLIVAAGGSWRALSHHSCRLPAVRLNSRRGQPRIDRRRIRREIVQEFGRCDADAKVLVRDRLDQRRQRLDRAGPRSVAAAAAAVRRVWFAQQLDQSGRSAARGGRWRPGWRRRRPCRRARCLPIPLQPGAALPPAAITSILPCENTLRDARRFFPRPSPAPGREDLRTPNARAGGWVGVGIDLGDLQRATLFLEFRRMQHILPQSRRFVGVAEERQQHGRICRSSAASRAILAVLWNTGTGCGGRCLAAAPGGDSAARLLPVGATAPQRSAEATAAGLCYCSRA